MATVRLNFNDGTHNYDFPLVQSVSDPKEGMKATIIDGTRSDGCIVIPGGKKSQEITVKGLLVDKDGYINITTKMATLKNSVTTEVATLTLKHLVGVAYVTDWQYTVRRIDEIRFPDSLRTSIQEYEIKFLILLY